MRRTEKKLKSKGIKGCDHTRRVSVGYDRNYVARYFKDVTHLPFSRTSSCDRDRRYDKRLSHYLKRWFMKQVGKSIDDVFHNFKRLGWDNTYDMYYYWNWYVRVDDHLWDYYIDENGCLAPSILNSFDYTLKDKESDEGDAKEEKKTAVRRRASEKRLTRKFLEHNESIDVFKSDCRLFSRDEYAKYMGTFYVEYKNIVIKFPVYYLSFPQNPEYKKYTWRNSWQYYRNEPYLNYVPVTILGIYREVLKFERHHWNTKIETKFNEKEQILEAEIINYDTGPGKLIPHINKSEARSLLKKVTCW